MKLAQNHPKTLIIAEAGVNHNGDLKIAKELIRQAAMAGADIVKFQLGWRGKPGEINHITEKDLKNILFLGKYFSIEIMFSIFTPELLNRLVHA